MPDQIPHKVIYEKQSEPLEGEQQRIKFEQTESSTRHLSNIYIPAGRNQFLFCENSCLNFTLQGKNIAGNNLPATANNTTNGLYLAPLGAVAAIETVTVLQNNKVVSQLDNYNKICAILQVCNNEEAGAGFRGVTAGNCYMGDQNRMSLVPNNLINQYGSWTINKAPTAPATAGNVDTPPMSFSIPLMGLLGNACVPLNELKDGLQIQIKWTPNIRDVIWTNSSGTKDDPTASPAVVGTATKIVSGDLHVSNVSYEASVRTLDDSSYKAVADENKFDSQPIEWSDQHFYLTEKQYLSSDLSVAGRVHTIVPSFRFSSLNNIFNACFSNLSSDGYDLNPPNVPHIAWDKIRYRIGGIEHPTNMIDNLPKMVQHTVACCSNCNPASAVNMMSSEYTQKNYRDITTIPAAGSSPAKWDRGVCGVGVKSFPDIDAVGGVDTRFVDTEFEAYKTAVATTAPLTNVWVAQYDCVYVIADGVLSFSDGT